MTKEKTWLRGREGRCVILRNFFEQFVLMKKKTMTNQAKIFTMKRHLRIKDLKNEPKTKRNDFYF